MALISLLLSTISLLLVGYWMWSMRRKTSELDFKGWKQSLGPTIKITTPPRFQPYGKPSGKRSPKVNDDEAGWQREQKQEQDYWPDPNH